MKLLVLLIIIIFFTILITTTKKKQKKNNENYKKLIAKKLVRQASRYATASLQDKSLLLEVLHANYATGYLLAAKDVLSSDEITEASGIDSLVFERKIVDIQDKATVKLIKFCPGFQGEVDDKLLAVIAGESV